MSRISQNFPDWELRAVKLSPSLENHSPIEQNSKKVLKYHWKARCKRKRAGMTLHQTFLEEFPQTRWRQVLRGLKQDKWACRRRQGPALIFFLFLLFITLSAVYFFFVCRIASSSSCLLRPCPGFCVVSWFFSSSWRWRRNLRMDRARPLAAELT